MASKQLTKFLTSPSRIASSLDWKKLSGSVLSMNVTNRRINLSLASHPEQDQKVMNLPDIPLKLEKTNDNRRVVKKEILQEIQDLCQRNKVAGIIVSWPVQQGTGRVGHDCGKVLHTLDSMAQHSQILTPNRPFCLWDGQHIHAEQDDEWGRAARYGQNSCQDPTSVYKASESQYNQAAHDDAAHVWQDFCQHHWPEYCLEEPRLVQLAGSKKDEDVSLSCLVEELDENHAKQYLHATLHS